MGVEQNLLPIGIPWVPVLGAASLCLAGLQWLPASHHAAVGAALGAASVLRGQMHCSGASHKGARTACAGGRRQGIAGPRLAGTGQGSAPWPCRQLQPGRLCRLLALGHQHAPGEVTSTALMFLWHAFPFMGCLFCNPQVF